MIKIITLIYFAFVVIVFSQNSSNVNLYKQDSLNLFNNSKVVNIDENQLIKIQPMRNWDLKIKNIENIGHSFPYLIELKPKKKSFVESELFYLAVGSAVLLGASAAYLKTESDKNYEKYLNTTDKKYLNKTNELDIYSGAALGALQINFGYLIYKFLTD